MGVVLLISMTQSNKHNTVLVFGTFDLLHAGHHSFLRQAKRLGSHLIVAVGHDHVVRRLKGKRPVQPERVRLKKIAALPYVDRAVLASKNPRQRFSFIKKLSPNVIALGYDQTHYTANLARQLRRRGITARIVRLQPYKPNRYKSSLLHRRLVNKTKT